jgi:ABC-2 type transport system permease protein
VKKEFLQLKKDRKMFGISLIAPIIQLLLLGYAANIDIKNITLVINDNDNTKISREYTQSLTNSGYFLKIANVDKMNDIDKYIDGGKASVGIIIPQKFEENILSGKTVQISSIIDGSDSNTASIGMNYLNMITSQYTQRFIKNKLEKLKSLNINSQLINSKIRIWYNPELKSKNFMIPGVLGMLLMIITLILTSLAIVKEKEIGTLEQLIVTPIKPIELILGKLIPFTIIGIVDIILVLLVASLWFNIPIKGNVFLLFGLSIIFLISTLGLGLFVSTVASNQQQAMMISIFFLQMPMMFLSGFIFPIENMPKIIQVLTYIMPLRYYFNIVRGLFLKGVGLSELWFDGLMLLIIGIIIFIISVARFKKRIT